MNNNYNFLYILNNILVGDLIIMLIQKSYKFRIYPTEEQKLIFRKTFGCCRFTWNKLLEERNKYYEEHKTYLSNITPSYLKDIYPFLKEVDSLALSAVNRFQDQAFKNYFKNPKKFGKPQFKSKKNINNNSYKTNFTRSTYKNKQYCNISIDYDNNILNLPKIPNISIKLYRKFPINSKLISVTISETKTHNFYASINFEYDNQVSERNNLQKSIGLDMSLQKLYVDSNGNSPLDFEKLFAENQKELAELQRRYSWKLSHSTNKKSKNIEELRLRISKLHEFIVNKRTDIQHKISNELARKYDYIFIEDLSMKGMQKSNHGKSIMDISWYQFTNMLKYKCIETGSHIHKIHRDFPSSQTCHNCGQIHPEMKELNRRIMKCDCGNICDRDYNAAMNILDEGIKEINEGENVINF